MFKMVDFYELLYLISTHYIFYFFYSNTPFVRWDSDRITAWMNEIGLNMYLVECRKYVKNGDQLLKFSSHELEKVRYMIFFLF